MESRSIEQQDVPFGVSANIFGSSEAITIVWSIDSGDEAFVSFVNHGDRVHFLHYGAN